MKRIAIAVTVALGLVWAVSSMAALTGPVRVETGLVTGAAASDPSVSAFRGLPYAAPPVGDLRPEYGDTTKRGYDYIDAWLTKPGRL